MKLIHKLIAPLAAALFAGSALGALPATTPGAPDPTFGTSGRTVAPYSASYDYVMRLLVQPDGRYVAIGYGGASSQLGLGFVARQLHDGSADPSFYGTGSRVFGDAATGAYLFDGVLLPDGRILAIGNLYTKGAAAGFLTRLLPDGSTDASFGVDGIVRLTTPGFPWVEARNVALLPDGRIVAIVQENDQDDIADRAYALRLLPDGTPDTTFGPQGRVYFDQLALHFQPERMALTGDGKIVAAGWMWTSGPDIGAVVRLNANGTPDASFASGGLFTYSPPGRTTHLSDVLIDPSDMIVVTGYTGDNARSGFVIRLKSSGAPDSGFGFQGVLTLPASTVGAAAVGRQADGKLVVAAHFMPSSDYHIQVVRLLPNGAYDASFGAGGFAPQPATNREFANALLVDADGKIIVSGSTRVASVDHSLIARVLGAEITTPVIEFYNGVLDHYFITADPNEAAAIDSGGAGPGWARTGQTFKSGGPNRVCRFYGSPDIDPVTSKRRGPNSHFYTIDAGECGIVKKDAGWKFESYDFNGWAMVNNACPQGTQGVKRVYNKRFAQNDSNHRYITTDGLYQQMIAQGWAGEGTVLCAAL